MLRVFIASALCGVAVALAGCASPRQPLVLGSIGPSAPQPSPLDSQGSLVVFTARDPHAHFNGSPYHQYYSDYKVCDEQGNLLQTIHNDSGTYVDGPAEVKLPAGKYRVLARASGSREVAVPVIIASHQVTTVHLDSVGTAASN